MIRKYLKLISLTILMTGTSLYSFSLNALTQMISASSAKIDPDYSNCIINSDGSISSDGSTCTLYLHGTGTPSSGAWDVTSVSIYYYDNSGSQSMYAYLQRDAVSSTTTSSSTVGSTADTTTSSSVQTSTISVSTTDIASTSYFYYIKVSLNYGTRLLGVRIN